MTATDELAFLSAICAEPGDDTVRLVYADWLEESGEPDYAAFVRESVRDGKEWTLSKNGLANTALMFEKRRLRVPDEFANGTLFVVSRGFVSRVTCTAEDWLKHADALSWHPSQTVPYGYDSERPRPCPSTAQPIRRVALTTCPMSAYRTWRIHHPVGTEWGDVLKAEFPGIEITFPFTPEAELEGAAHAPTDDEMLDDILDSPSYD